MGYRILDDSVKRYNSLLNENGEFTDLISTEKTIVTLTALARIRMIAKTYRNKELSSVERFRKHVWWVGGNATDYRPLLGTAVQLSSCEMADVVGEVAVRFV